MERSRGYVWLLLGIVMSNMLGVYVANAGIVMTATLKLIMIVRKLECTAVCNTEYMGLSMEVHTFTQLLMTIPAVATYMPSMLLITIPIVATHIPETSPQLVSSQLFPLIYKIENKICLRKTLPEVLTVLCPTMSLWCPQK